MSELKTDTPLYCYRHPKTETGVRCSRCERPICVRCMVQSPVGMRCRDCGLARSAVYDASLDQVALGCLVGIVMGYLAGWLGSSLQFFSLFIAPALGALVSEITLKCMKRRRSLGVAVIVAAAIALGALFGNPVRFAAFLNQAPFSIVLQSLEIRLTSFWYWLFVVLCAPIAFYRLHRL